MAPKPNKQGLRVRANHHKPYKATFGSHGEEHSVTLEILLLVTVGEGAVQNSDLCFITTSEQQQFGTERSKTKLFKGELCPKYGNGKIAVLFLVLPNS